jgi:hypothetical protein
LNIRVIRGEAGRIRRRVMVCESILTSNLSQSENGDGRGQKAVKTTRNCLTFRLGALRQSVDAEPFRTPPFGTPESATGRGFITERK